MTTRDPLLELRQFLMKHTQHEVQEATGLSLLDAALSAARAVALEEAMGAVGEAFREVERGTSTGSAYRSGVLDLHALAQSKMAALITTPAPASTPVDDVREALRGVRRGGVDADGRVTIPYGRGVVDACDALAKSLGVPLDAAQETTCPTCGHPPHAERCVRAVSPTHSRGGAVAARACGCEATP